jgi:sigma-B regulation protein RsbU (phosphoserine phosphatase)
MEENIQESKILIVDDEPDVEILMKQRFRKQIREKKFTLKFGHNGVEALEILSDDPEICMVISDINMPEMDGLTLLKNMSEKFPSVVPVIISAYGDVSTMGKAKELGAYSFVTKPINCAKLNITIDETINKKTG